MHASTIVQWVIIVALAAVIVDLTRVVYSSQVPATADAGGDPEAAWMVGTKVETWLSGRCSGRDAKGAIVLVGRSNAIGWWRLRGRVPEQVGGLQVVQIPVERSVAAGGSGVGLRERWRGQFRLPVALLVDRRGVVVRAAFVNTVERWEWFAEMCSALLLGSEEVCQRVGIAGVAGQIGEGVSREETSG